MQEQLRCLSPCYSCFGANFHILSNHYPHPRPSCQTRPWSSRCPSTLLFTTNLSPGPKNRKAEVRVGGGQAAESP